MAQTHLLICRTLACVCLCLACCQGCATVAHRQDVSETLVPAAEGAKVERPPRPIPTVAQASYIPDELSQPPAKPGYLQQGPVFNPQADPQAPRGLAEQVQRLQRENRELSSQIEDLKKLVADLRHEVQEVRNAATRAEQTGEATKRELTATRSQLQARQLELQRVLERMQANEQAHVEELDEMVSLVQSTLRKYQEDAHGKPANRPR